MVVLGLLFLLVVMVTDVGKSDDPLSPEELRLAEEGIADQVEPVRFTVSVSGDLLIHSPLWTRALENGGGDYDFTPFFEAIRPWIAGPELALCHLETPLTTGEPASYPVFATPDELADAVEATGWDACDTASNHSLDGGLDGIATTGEELDRRGIEHTGSFAEAGRRGPLLLDAGRVKVALVAYTDMTNGIPLPEPWAVNVVPADEPVRERTVPILGDARRAREAGADVVMVNMHWGDENSTEPNDSQVELADALTASPLVDVVVGQGPHVVQPIRRMNGKFVVFSEGNLVSNQSALVGLPAETQDGLIALLDFIADGHGVRVERVRYVPTWVRLDDYVVLSAEAGSDPDYAESLRESRQRTVGIAGRGPRIVPVG